MFVYHFCMNPFFLSFIIYKVNFFFFFINNHVKNCDRKFYNVISRCLDPACRPLLSQIGLISIELTNIKSLTLLHFLSGIFFFFLVGYEPNQVATHLLLKREKKNKKVAAHFIIRKRINNSTARASYKVALLHPVIKHFFTTKLIMPW